MTVQNIILIFLAIMNLVGFFSMGIDKRKARKKLWRIPEVTLFLIAIFGGSLGSMIGMYVFHHKTRHWYFVFGMPLIFILQLALAIYLVYFSPFQFYIM